MGHNRDQAGGDNARNLTSNDCSGEPNENQSNTEEQIQEVWSYNSISRNQVNNIFIKI